MLIVSLSLLIRTKSRHEGTTGKLEKEREAKGKGMNYNVQIENYDVNVQFVVEVTCH